MATYQLRRLCRPELLRAIDIEQLDELLRPHTEYLARHGITLPIAGREAPLKYIALVQLFIAPQEGMPRELIDALYFIDDLSTPTGLELLESAAVGRKAAAVAEQPHACRNRAPILAGGHRPGPERACPGRRQPVPLLEYFQSRGEETPQLTGPLDLQIAKLEAELNERFHARGRGRYRAVFRGLPGGQHLVLRRPRRPDAT